METVESGGIDVWFRFTEGMERCEVERDHQILDPAESARSDQFLFESDRRDYTAAHALLRRTLSRRWPVAPNAWRFDTAPGGKPRIVEDFISNRTLAFSLSHARGLVTCAVGESVDIGVDVEAVDRSAPVDDLASQLFSAVEARSLAAESPPERCRRFIELWTLKEAYVKAIGAGLTHRLDSFGFEFGSETALRFENDSPCRVERWRFALFALGASGEADAYRLAVAVQSHGDTIGNGIYIRDATFGAASARLIRTSIV